MFFKKSHRPDYLLISVIFILMIAGLIILASASSELGRIKFDDSYYYLTHQIIFGLSFGLAGFLAAYLIPYKNYKYASFALLIFSIILLALVFTKIGISSGGASRWLKIGPIVFQPAELVKMTFILYLAAWLSNLKMNRGTDFWTGFMPFVLISGFIAALLVLQPATSTMIILMGTGLVMYFISGARIVHIASVALVGLMVLGLIIWLTPYRLQRVTTFLNHEKDASGAAYQINQSLNAIGSGGLFGVGYGRSTSKSSYLPDPIDDSIFAVAAEELGFVGSGVLTILFGLLVFRLFWLAKNLRDKFGQLILVGFGSLVAFQSLVNMGAISGLLPLTGVPLPFISYGGTALAVFLTLGGISANISKYA
ncbi:MAG: putative peptidoglycan glycosyltransferase FtsW [Candidatus Liptonbacteria bacterium]|nr:putative peptidoglycan glycosyltransferase FtsW [Candidatus Liptonbacteria bacterium]